MFYRKRVGEITADIEDPKRLEKLLRPGDIYKIYDPLSPYPIYLIKLQSLEDINSKPRLNYSGARVILTRDIISKKLAWVSLNKFGSIYLKGDSITYGWRTSGRIKEAQINEVFRYKVESIRKELKDYGRQ